MFNFTKTILLLALTAAVCVGCSETVTPEGDSPPVVMDEPNVTEPEPPVSDVADNDFTLTCVVDGEQLLCTLRNVTTAAIDYSDYTIGYHEAIVLERYDAEAEDWVAVPWREDVGRFWAGVGARQKNVKTVAAGASIPAKWGDGETPSYSFFVSLDNYELPVERLTYLRVTQKMGTFSGSDLSVWKGDVISDTLAYRSK